LRDRWLDNDFNIEKEQTELLAHYIRKAIHSGAGNVTQVARKLNIKPDTLNNKIRKNQSGLRDVLEADETTPRIL